jgi:hypothetical protein
VHYRYIQNKQVLFLNDLPRLNKLLKNERVENKIKLIHFKFNLKFKTKRKIAHRNYFFGWADELMDGQE